MTRKYPYQHVINVNRVPATSMFAASAPESVLNSFNVRQAVAKESAIVLHPMRGSIHADPGRHPLNQGRFVYGRPLARLAADRQGLPNWKPQDNWMRPQDNFGPFMAADQGFQPLGVRLMANGRLRAAEEVIQRERDIAEMGWSGIDERITTAAVGAEIDVDQVVDHLRVIKLFPELIGRAPMEFHVAKGFRNVPAPWLDFRVAAHDPFAGKNFRMPPLSEPTRTQSRFYEAFISCRKDRELIHYPLETRYRATQFDPLTVDRENAAYSLAFKRNLACIMELAQIGNRVGPDGEITTSATLSEISARSTTTGKSVNNILAELQLIVTKQFLYHRVRMTTWYMNPLTFLYITQNDHVRAGGEYGRTPVSIPYGGMIQMPTMPGIDIIVDARLPSNRIFMTDKMWCLWLGEGPKRIETIDQKIKQETLVDFTDFYDAFCIHRDIAEYTERRYGCTVYLAAGDSAD